MTATGWYNVVTLGTRDGVFDYELHRCERPASGRPYGSMAYLAVVVPNAMSNGNSLPEIQVLAQGLIVPTYNADGTTAGEPILQQSRVDSARCPAAAAAGRRRRSISLALPPRPRLIAISRSTPPILTATRSRFRVSNAIWYCRKKRSAGDVVRGIRNAARLVSSHMGRAAYCS